MARPEKQPEEKRRERFNLRFTIAEIEGLRHDAIIAGLEPHEFARRRVLGSPIHPPPGRADAALISEINRIGVNVNQLARAQNADKEYRGDWRAIETELRRVLEKVAAIYADAGLIAQLARLDADIKEIARRESGEEFLAAWREIEEELRRAIKRAGRRHDS